VVTDVFTLVWVGAGNNDGIDIQAAHLLAQRLKVRKSLSTHNYILVLCFVFDKLTCKFTIFLLMKNILPRFFSFELCRILAEIEVVPAR
jgi:hypothetical protein